MFVIKYEKQMCARNHSALQRVPKRVHPRLDAHPGSSTPCDCLGLKDVLCSDDIDTSRDVLMSGWRTLCCNGCLWGSLHYFTNTCRVQPLLSISLLCERAWLIDCVLEACRERRAQDCCPVFGYFYGTSVLTTRDWKSYRFHGALH